MRIGRKCTRFLLAASAGAISVAALASETTTYTYDPLGRLVAAVRSGTVNNGQASSLCYDAAGNRTLYQSSSAGTLATCGAPPPPPPPSNQPPVANSDWLSLPEWTPGTVDVIANDTDADGHYPLSIESISDPSGVAYIASSTEIGWYGSGAGSYTVSYVAKDSLGATATGTLTVEVSFGSGCGTYVCE